MTRDPDAQQRWESVTADFIAVQTADLAAWLDDDPEPMLLVMPDIVTDPIRAQAVLMFMVRIISGALVDGATDKGRTPAELVQKFALTLRGS